MNYFTMLHMKQLNNKKTCFPQFDKILVIQPIAEVYGESSEQQLCWEIACPSVCYEILMTLRYKLHIVLLPLSYNFVHILIMYQVVQDIAFNNLLPIQWVSATLS